MTRQQSEGEVHVEAMRLILAAMERREDLPDWTIWQHMLNMLETIFQGIENQRDDDRDKLMHTRKDRDAKQAEIETLRQQLADAQRAVSDAFAEVNSVREQLNAATEPAPVCDLDREREVPEVANLNTLGQLFQHAVSDAFSEINSLRQQLDAAQAAVTLQRAGIERLQAFVGGIDNLLEQDRFDRRDIAELLIVLRSNSSATLTSSPAPVAEPLDAEGGA